MSADATPAPGASSVAVVMAAAGRGTRLPGDVPKQWRPLGGIPLIAHSFRLFDAMAQVGQLVFALDAETLNTHERTSWLDSAHGTTVRLVEGGAHRQDSVWRALQALDPVPEIVLIHDAARPFPDPEAVEACIDEARRTGGAILARPVVETLKRVDDEGRIVDTVDRAHLWAAQTPQGFRAEPLIEAYRARADRLDAFTDDAGIYEAAGGTVRVVAGSAHNLKITLPEDFARAERLLAEIARDSNAEAR